MMVQIGYYSLLMASLLAAWSAVASLLCIASRSGNMLKSAENASISVLILLTASSASLIHGFITDDFSLEYVAHYSSVDQHFLYKLAAFWAGQAGSLLLWAWLLSLFAFIVIFQNKKKNRELVPPVISTLMGTEFFFIILLIFVNNPFSIIPPPADGVGLNPQLLNPYMIIHPPTLYVGYVGFTVPFAFAISALALKRTGEAWIVSARRWSLFSWFFLGIGIILGSYWAYIELGWGGYWAWDPVENASLMPWLTGTAFLHSIMIQEKRRMLKVWNMLLIIITFCLCIFGTFITRSGIISSVHAFAESNIGSFFAVFLALAFIGSIILLLFRLPALKGEHDLDSILSKESMFMFNNLILVGMACTIFVLTVFPLFSEFLSGKQMTIGPPVYNQVNIPWGIILLLLTGICPMIAWRKASLANMRRNFLSSGIWFFCTIAVLLIFGIHTLYPLITYSLAVFVFCIIATEFSRGIKSARRSRTENFLSAFIRMVAGNTRRYGGYIVHLGIVLIFVGIAGSSALQEERTQVLSLGQSMTMNEYTLKFSGFKERDLPGRHNILLSVAVRAEGEDKGTLETALNDFPQFGVATEIGILREIFPLSISDLKRLGEDLYVIPMGFDSEKSIASFKIYINPLINFLWLGGIILFLGALITLMPGQPQRGRIGKALPIKEKQNALPLKKEGS